ncbi:MAG: glycosyltransferase family 4 protein [Actinomycetales bacterium]|nr:glycosyltransferase family 4 protein [Actinomycetales bacterium]
MRIGIVCPYAWDVPGGVSAHVHDLANALIKKGHYVSVIAPAESDEDLPFFVESTGKPRAVRYNGSVARLSFGPIVARRVSKWIEQGEFDVLHVHEPLAPSVSVLACWAAKGPIVATWHSSMDRSRVIMSLAKLAQTVMEKVSARIAVSPAAKQTMFDHLGGDAVVIPNGVDVAGFTGAIGLPEWNSDSPTLVFLGRVDEPRKGLSVLLAAFPKIRREFPDLKLLIAGPGDCADLLSELTSADQAAITHVGRVTDEAKPNVYASGDIYVAPNTGGESFGIVLLEAMASGTPVVASDLPAFHRVLNGGESGRLFKNEDSDSLAREVIDLLRDKSELARLKKVGLEEVQQYDWASVANEILEVYKSVAVPGLKVEPDMAGQMLGRLGRLRITPEREMDL